MTEMPTDLAEANRQMIEQFRAAGGKLEGRPMLLLNTTGRKTGERRTNPMMYVKVDDKLLVVASNAGAAKNPDWFRNLVAHPHVTVEHDGEVFPATAEVAAGAERDELFAKVVEQYPFFADHQAGTERAIPVVSLVR
jgi:deazaflavin-dependent oxidoreductase (nitroreductase family)